ncbi:GNAT family N-acetyltransferase [Paenibacillus planticolens]|uniref:GNAT family N-acetyltransferase n=1 Tax=Paenibacillus planticolens TaxID=2654976 RepID=A0ABX1ZVS6_9BACL|nr:GNAT family N-acetyltransferase [Paenibacillus planticolens]NOV03926.1 GNAT family N-acetyltransferase [Paenibacillus planticolens]
MNIQVAKSTHQQAISECVDAAYSMYIERMGKKPAPMVTDYSEPISKGLVHVAVDREEVKGLIVLIPKTNYLLIENVAVHPSFQGQGIGHELIEFGIESARKVKFKEVCLYTNELMTENIKYYLKFGFIEVDRRIENGFNRVYMSKPL